MVHSRAAPPLLILQHISISLLQSRKVSCRKLLSDRIERNIEDVLCEVQFVPPRAQTAPPPTVSTLPPTAFLPHVCCPYRTHVFICDGCLFRFSTITGCWKRGTAVRNTDYALQHLRDVFLLSLQPEQISSAGRHIRRSV